MLLRMLSAALCLPLLVSCGTPQTIVLTDRPPAPPPWLMTACPPWPAMGGDGRVPIEHLAAAIRAAQVAHAACEARAEGLQRYVLDVVRPH